MQIKDMFRKKIDREIQGVIIVGQGEETNVAQELEEYVVTRELQRHFADFFAAFFLRSFCCDFFIFFRLEFSSLRSFLFSDKALCSLSF